MSASHKPMTAQEAVEILESAGNEMSASGYTRWRYFWPRTINYGVLDLTDVEDLPRYLDALTWAAKPEYQTPEEREQFALIERANSTDIWPYLRKRTKRRRERARIIRKLIHAQAVLAHLRADTWSHAVARSIIEKYISKCDAALLALDEGGAQ